jgi:hypothetical protein
LNDDDLAGLIDGGLDWPTMFRLLNGWPTRQNYFCYYSLNYSYLDYGNLNGSIRATLNLIGTLRLLNDDGDYYCSDCWSLLAIL